MARLPDLEIFAREHGLKIGSIVDLIHHRSRTERLIERVAERPLMTPAGAFRLVVYRDKLVGCDASRADAGPDIARDRNAGARARAAVGDRSARRRERLAFVEHPGSAARDRRRGPRRHRAAAPLGERRRSCAGARSPASRRLRRRWTCATTASVRRSCATCTSAGCDCSRGQRKMPSMAGFDLEVTGYDEAPPRARSAPARTRSRCRPREMPDHRRRRAARPASGDRAGALQSAHRRRPAGRRVARAEGRRRRRRQHHHRQRAGCARGAARAAAARAKRRTTTRWSRSAR